MRRTTTRSRWPTPQQRYAGTWRQNPWINAMFIASQARGDTDGGSTAVGVRDGQQKAAVSRWENEGGSLGTQQGARR